ncbi:hypothetical protein Bca101_023378 [Brassica carinata]
MRSTGVEADTHGGAVGNPPEIHGVGGQDSETEVRSSSSHGKRQSHERLVVVRATEEGDVEGEHGRTSSQRWGASIETEIPTPAARGLTGVEENGG